MWRRLLRVVVVVEMSIFKRWSSVVVVRDIYMYVCMYVKTEAVLSVFGRLSLSFVIKDADCPSMRDEGQKRTGASRLAPRRRTGSCRRQSTAAAIGCLQSMPDVGSWTGPENVRRASPDVPKGRFQVAVRSPVCCRGRFGRCGCCRSGRRRRRRYC